jgi:hypothetical protein
MIEAADKVPAGAAWRPGILLSLAWSFSLALAACAHDDSAGRAPASGSAPLRELTGLAPSQVAALYGQPDFRRTDPPAEVWQYRSADCVLDLFFYSGDGGERLVFAQSRPRSPQQDASAGHCFDGASALRAHIQQTKL